MEKLIAKSIQDHENFRNEYLTEIKDRFFIHHTTLSHFYKRNIDNELKRPIFKIKYGKKVLYRKFTQGASYGIGSGEIGLFNIDLKFLSNPIDNILNKEIEVTIANLLGKFLFYYYNPRESIWIAFRILVWGIPISFLINIITTLLFK